MTMTSEIVGFVSHYTKLYYLLHYAAFAFFLYARTEIRDRPMRSLEEQKWYNELVGNDLTGIPRELQIWGCLGMICLSRTFRAKSLHEVIGTALGFSKACICVTLFIADWTWPFYFLAIWIVLFFIVC